MFTDAGLNNWLKIAFLGLIWGSSFMMIEVAIEGFGPLTVAAVRIIIGAVVLCTYAFATGAGLPALRGENAGKIWLSALAMAAFSNALPFATLSWAQQYVTSGFAGISMAVVPLFVLPLAHFLVPGDRLTIAKSLGFFLGFIGIVLLIGKGAFDSSGNSLENLGRMATITAAAFYACGSIVTRLCPKVRLRSLSAAALLLAAVMSTAIALYVEGIPASLPLKPLIASLYLGLIPTALATVLLVSVAREAGPSFLGLSNYMVPVWSVIFGVSILNETLPPQLFWALGLILTGLAVSQIRRRRQAQVE